MTKELQDHVWSILPKEFRKEVKKEYKVCTLGCRIAPAGAEILGLRGCCRELEDLFGEDNLTSDAEGDDEMLTVPRKAIIQAYEKSCAKRATKYDVGYADCLYNLFGSKCLSDEDDHEDNFAKSGPKPAEPKFKIGDKVRVKVNAKELHSNPNPSKKIYYWQTTRDKYLGKVFKITDIWKSGTITLNTSEVMFWEPFDLEPYTESEENQNLSDSKELKPQDVDKHFDNILKDSFRDHNRLHIAAMMVPSVIATVPCSENEKGYAKMVATRARILADALISECNKGGKE